jgi:chromosomal replication initiator protein
VEIPNLRSAASRNLMFSQHVRGNELNNSFNRAGYAFVLKYYIGKNCPRAGGKMGTVVENKLWDNILQTLERNLNPQSFESWFAPISLEGFDPIRQLLVLRAPSQVVKDWVTSNYEDVLRRSLTELNLGAYAIEWIVGERAGNESLQEGSPEGTEAYVAVGSVSENQGQQPQAAFAHAGGGHATASKPKSSLYSLLDAAAADGLIRNDQPYVDPGPLVEGNLNPKYSFGTFVVGSCNQFAHAASQAVAEAPGKTYNPLYMYGGVGLGKTHLMHAAGQAIKATNRHMKLSYISAEKFMNELINAIRYDKTQIFREKYRSIDVLLIDDIQFMAGKERTQEEFFHTFNALYDNQKQIVITSDCPPREIPTLEERLHSRFEWGLIADIEPPDLETKIAILKRKADMDGVELPDDVAFFIASKVKSNIRELEGSLIRLVAISSLRGVPITKIIAQDAIKNIAQDDENQGITIQQIQQSVSNHFRLRMDELTSKNNARQVAVPRQVAMYLCKQLTKHSFPEIGRAFGGKHHTTVMHSVEKIGSLLATDQNLQRTVNELTDQLGRT